MNNLKKLTDKEIQALKSVGKIAENWYAVSYSENELPYVIFREEADAMAYKNQFSATSIVEPWPMLIKDFSKGDLTKGEETMKTENVDPMNTEQLKTAEEILNHHYVHDNMMTQQKGWIINAMNSFASQESKRAVEKDRESRWISVKERLPEIGQEVNVIVIGNRVTSLARKIRYEGDKEYSWDNSYPGSGNWHAKEAVTHWQPLPEAPKNIAP